MSEATKTDGGTITDKIQNQFNEEKWTRITSKDVSISRFKILEALLADAKSDNVLEDIKELSKEHLKDYEASVAARYFIGMIGLQEDNPEEIIFLKQLLDQFQEASKWAVVEYLSDKMLEVN